MSENVMTGPIVVGVDGSDSSVDALRHAARLSTALDMPLEAVTAWSYPPFADAYVIDAWSPEEDAKAILDGALTQAFGHDVPEGMARTIVAGPPAPALIDASERAGMLVLGSRGHGGFVGLLLGSVSSACAEYAQCPVLVVHRRRPEKKRR